MGERRGSGLGVDELAIERLGDGDVPLNEVRVDGRLASGLGPGLGSNSKRTSIIVMENRGDFGDGVLEGAGDIKTMAVQDEREKGLPWSTLARWRKGVVLLGLFLGLFLSTLDTSIVATALVTILTDFNDFALSPWVVLAYMLTYMALAVAFARLSDVYGRKRIVLVAWVIFTAFSVGCGTSQSMIQLIVCRAFQGIGGSGMYSMTMVMIPEIVSSKKIGAVSGLIGMTLGCSGILGPILGGVISHLTTWRWIFFINIPIGCFAVSTILIAWPPTPGSSHSSWVAFQSIDLFGITLVLAASTMHIWGFESAGVMDYEWNSPAIITVLILSASCWITFVCWELFLESRPKSTIKALFPFRIVKQRVMAAALVLSFLTGLPYIVSVIILPERFQIVNGASSLMAGVYLLPLLSASAIGSFLGGVLSKKRYLSSPTLILSTVLQLAGCGLLSIISSAIDIKPRQYVFEVILGLGIGLSLSTTTIITTMQAKRGDLAAAQGAIAQVRVLGGIVGLSIATTIFNRRSRAALSDTLAPSELDALYKSPLAEISFPPDQQDFVKGVYADVFSLQMKVLMFVCVVAVVVSLSSWERSPRDMEVAMRVHQRPPSPPESDGG